MGVRDNAQMETQLLAEWVTSLPRGWQNKTHVAVGKQVLQFQGKLLTPAQQAAFSVWSDWADMRIFTGAEVWLVEGKIVNRGGAYGQLYDYLGEYTQSADYVQFNGYPVVGVVVCAFERPQTSARFANWGLRTIVHTPSWAGNSLATKLFSGATSG